VAGNGKMVKSAAEVGPRLGLACLASTRNRRSGIRADGALGTAECEAQKQEEVGGPKQLYDAVVEQELEQSAASRRWTPFGSPGVMWGRQYNCRPRARDAVRGAPKGVQQPKEVQAATINEI
jgi:hypothetical protein